MAKNDKTKGVAELIGGVEVLRPVDEWAGAKGLQPYVFAAVCEAAGWAEGRVVNEATFDNAVNAWLNAPMSGGGE